MLTFWGVIYDENVPILWAVWPDASSFPSLDLTFLLNKRGLQTACLYRLGGHTRAREWDPGRRYSGLNCVSPKFICCSPNSRYLWKRPYLQVGPLQWSSRYNEVVRGTLVQFVCCPYKKETLGQRHTQREDDGIPTERMPWEHEDGHPQTKEWHLDHMLPSQSSGGTNPANNAFGPRASRLPLWDNASMLLKPPRLWVRCHGKHASQWIQEGWWIQGLLLRGGLWSVGPEVQQESFSYQTSLQKQWALPNTQVSI